MTQPNGDSPTTQPSPPASSDKNQTNKTKGTPSQPAKGSPSRIKDTNIIQRPTSPAPDKQTAGAHQSRREKRDGPTLTQRFFKHSMVSLWRPYPRNRTPHFKQNSAQGYTLRSANGC